MQNRLVLCAALVAFAFCAAHADKGLGASLDLNLNKGDATPAAAAAEATAASQGTAAAAASGVAVLSVPQVAVDLAVKKELVPLLTVSDAPCKNICKDKCTITLEEHCLTVDVPKKNCNIEKKTITKRLCEKKCKPSLKLDLPEFKLPTLPQDAPANPNPSAPPAAANPSAPPATLQAAAELAQNGRRLQSLDMECHDVCVDVPIILPDLQCTETTEQVEKCTKVPNKECKQECICLPQKSLSLNLPKKPALSVSVDASNSNLDVDASASSQRALKDVKVVVTTWFQELANKKFATISVPKIPNKTFATIHVPKMPNKTFATFPVPQLPNKTIATIDLNKKSFSMNKPQR